MKALNGREQMYKLSMETRGRFRASRILTWGRDVSLRALSLGQVTVTKLYVVGAGVGGYGDTIDSNKYTMGERNMHRAEWMRRSEDSGKRCWYKGG
jgi:hypothetical protein